MALFLFLGDISDIDYVCVQFCWLAESTTVRPWRENAST